MNIRNLTTTALLLCVIVNSAYAQEISLELDGLKNVRVICANKADKRILSYDAVQDRWCDNTVPNFCKHRQLDAARRVCKKQYAIALKKLPLEPKESLGGSVELGQTYLARVNGGRGYRELENELLDIQGKRLEIKRRMLALEKKEIVLKASISN